MLVGFFQGLVSKAVMYVPALSTFPHSTTGNYYYVLIDFAAGMSHHCQTLIWPNWFCGVKQGCDKSNISVEFFCIRTCALVYRVHSNRPPSNPYVSGQLICSQLVAFC